MKKLEIVIKPEKTSLMKAILSECDAKGAMFSRISGYGNQKGKQYEYHGVAYYETIFTKTKVETIVDEETAERLIARILEEIPTGEFGDGKIFIYDVVDVIRIRTGEKGPMAL